MGSYARELRTEKFDNWALGLPYGVLKAGRELKETIQEDSEVLEKLRQIVCDLDVADKPEGQLSFEQLRFRTTVDKFEYCIKHRQQLHDRLEEINRELREIFAECGSTLRRAEAYAIKAKYLAEKLRAAD